ncbi:phage tail assembly protein, partial [Yersinia pseudotuberculosis]
RITYPSLTTAECGRLELPDLVALAGRVIGFLSPKQAE